MSSFGSIVSHYEAQIPLVDYQGVKSISVRAPTLPRLEKLLNSSNFLAFISIMTVVTEACAPPNSPTSVFLSCQECGNQSEQDCCQNRVSPEAS